MSVVISLILLLFYDYIFLNSSITLQYQSEISKCVIHDYYFSKLISPTSEMLQLNWHIIYSILVLLNLKAFDSKVYLYNSSLWSTPILLSSISTTLLAKSIPKRYLLVCHSWSHPSLKWKYINLMLTPWCDSILIEITYHHQMFWR
jgi:hypothetical protein